MKLTERMTCLKKINAVLLLVILSLSLMVAPMGLLAQENEEIIATVNGVVITKAQFYDLLETEYGQYALQELVQKEIVRQKAEALQVTVADEEFAEVYSMIIGQLGGAQGLQSFLVQNNVTEDIFIEQLQWNMLLGELASAEVEVPEGAVATFFEENRTYYDQPETVEVSHILVETEEEAQEVLALLKDGGDLLTLAGEYSLDPGTATQGGYLGAIPRGYTVAPFEETAFSLPVGEYGLAESEFGWHIITVHAKTEAAEAVFDDIADQVERDYRASVALDIQNYMLKLEQESEIDIQWP